MLFQKFSIKQRTIVRLVAGAVVLLGGGHALATVLYLLPASPVKNETSGFVYKYMNTFFSQNWHLFSPHPGSSYVRLQLRCSNANNLWTSWIDPLAKIEAEHFKTRITGRGKVLYIYRRVGEGVWDDFAALQTQCKKQPPSLNKKETDAHPRMALAACAGEKAKLEWLRARPHYVLAKRLEESTCEMQESEMQKSETKELKTQLRLVRTEPVSFSTRGEKQPVRKAIVVPLYETAQQGLEAPHDTL